MQSTESDAVKEHFILHHEVICHVEVANGINYNFCVNVCKQGAIKSVNQTFVKEGKGLMFIRLRLYNSYLRLNQLATTGKRLGEILAHVALDLYVPGLPAYRPL